MRIGLVTFHRVPNFGAVLQTWSTAMKLRSMGAKVEILDYRAAGNEAMFARKGLRSFLPSIGGFKQIRFVQKYLSLSRPLRSFSEVERYVNSERFDCVVCGSDQVWKKDNRLGFDSAYFLGFQLPEHVRRVAYAPSCGDMVDYGNDATAARNCIARFQNLSARDSNTLKILDALGFPDVPRVVDPTFLADFSSLLTTRFAGEPYIAVVGGMDDSACRFIRNVAKTLGLRVMAVGTRCSVADRQMRFAGPEDWLNAIANANFVVTSLFHGAAISIKFRRPFVALDCTGRRAKIEDLVSHFGMSDRLVIRTGEEYEFNAGLVELDFQPYESGIEASIEKSNSFLRDAIRG